MLTWRTVYIRTIGLSIAAYLSSAQLEAKSDYAPGQVLVRYQTDKSTETIDAFEQTTGLRQLKRFKRSKGDQGGAEQGRLRLYRCNKGRSTAQLLAALSKDPAVRYVEPNYIRHYTGLPDDTEFDLLWGLNNTGQIVNGNSGTSDADIGYPEAWALARTPTTEVVVGVVDSGMSLYHPDLNGNLWTNLGEIANNGIDDDNNGYTDDVHGYDFGTDTHHMVDNDDHGTHVAGTIGALSNNATGITGVHGSVRLLPLKVEASDGTLYTSDIIDAFLYAADLKNSGVNLVAINASFAGPSFTQAEYDAIADMNTAGIILCAAAGNEGVNNDNTPSYPANYNLPNILSIAATDQNHDLANFSNFGNTTVDLAAPGVNIYSTLPLNFVNYSSDLSVGGNNYSTFTVEHGGTSPTEGITASLIACGLGYSTNFPANVDGQIALIQRGELNFSVKVENAMAAGAIGVVIYNNVSSPLNTWTLGREDQWIPCLQITQADGNAILAQRPSSGTLTNTGDLSTAYQFKNGTSMATPHVAGAVAFAALNFPAETVSQRIKRILNNVTPVASLSGLVATGGVLNLQQMVDTDRDALGDWWEADYFGDLSNSGTTDNDGDRQSNVDEFNTRTDPTSSNSRFRLDSISFHPTEGSSIQFQSAMGLNYQVLWRTSLNSGDWQILQNDIVGNGSTIAVPDPTATNADTRFYQLRTME